MMRSAFNKFFWGILFVNLEIHLVVFDLLADPVGYLMILGAANSFVSQYAVAKKVASTALVLAIISIPTVFIQRSTHAAGPIQQTSGWWWYEQALTILTLVVAFYIFTLMLDIAKKLEHQELLIKTQNTFKWYMGVSLLFMCTHPFLINVSRDMQIAYAFITTPFYIVITVLFLVLLRKFMKVEDVTENTPPTNLNTT